VHVAAREQAARRDLIWSVIAERCIPTELLAGVGWITKCRRKRGSTEVLPGLNPYSDLRPVSRLTLLNPALFIAKNVEELLSISISRR
jgi:hypothetical protein